MYTVICLVSLFVVLNWIKGGAETLRAYNMIQYDIMTSICLIWNSYMYYYII